MIVAYGCIITFNLYFLLCRYSLNQVLAIIEEEEDAFVSADVCLQPPADGRESDGDTDHEDEPVLDSSHFSKEQLLSEADFRIRYPNKTVDSSEINEVDEQKRY